MSAAKAPSAKRRRGRAPENRGAGEAPGAAVSRRRGAGEKGSRPACGAGEGGGSARACSASMRRISPRSRSSRPPRSALPASVSEDDTVIARDDVRRRRRSPRCGGGDEDDEE